MKRLACPLAVIAARSPKRPYLRWLFAIVSVMGAAALSSATSTPALAQTITYTRLDDPLATQPYGAAAFGISGNNIVGYYVDSSSVFHRFLYNGSTYTTLDDPLGAGETIAQGISGNNIVGWYVDSSDIYHGFLYNGSGYTTLDDPLAAQPYGTVAYGISGNNIVGTYSDSSGKYHGFLYNGSGYRTLDDPLGVGATYPQGISGNNIVGYYEDSSGNHDFLYNGSTYTTLDDPLAGPYGTQVEGISGNKIVGIYGTSYGQQGFEATIPSYWAAAGGGSWNTPGNWTTGTVPNGVGVQAVLGASLTSSSIITLDGNQTVGSLIFNNGTAGYTLAAGSGGTLTMDNSGAAFQSQIVVLAGTHSITAPIEIDNGNLTVSLSGGGHLSISGNISDDNSIWYLTLNGDGSGVLVLSGTNTYFPYTEVEAGKFVVTNPAALPAGGKLIVGAEAASIFAPIAPAAQSATAVPEPSTLALLAFAVVAFMQWNWPRHAKIGVDPRNH
jgi:autotransporter-associated beta strand protein